MQQVGERYRLNEVERRLLTKLTGKSLPATVSGPGLKSFIDLHAGMHEPDGMEWRLLSDIRRRIQPS